MVPNSSSECAKSSTRHAPEATIDAIISGEAFLTPPGLLYDLVVSAIREETGIEPALSTSGGTSDGRFLIGLCPVVDFGLPNATMHKVGEHAAIADIEALTRIYRRIIDKLLRLKRRSGRPARHWRPRRR